MTTTTTIAPIPAGATAPPAAIRVEGLTKRFGGTTAAASLSFEIPTGVVAGFVGPNGAGKTTTMGMLLGLTRPSAGTGQVLGYPISRPAAYLGRVGALIEGPAMWPGLTGRRNLQTLAALGGHDPAGIPALLELVGLADRADEKFRGYSLGMKQRLGIGAALLGDPDLLVLDEPSNGLDPAGMKQMRDLIRGLRREGRTVLVSSHLLGDLEQICDWLLVIDHGALLYAGPAADFLAGSTPVVYAAPEHPGDLARVVELGLAAGLDAGTDAAGTRMELPVSGAGADPRQVAVALNRAAIDAGIVLAELGVRRPDLETHYLARLASGIGTARTSEGAIR